MWARDDLVVIAPGFGPELNEEEVLAQATELTLPPVRPYQLSPKPALTPADWEQVTQRGPYDQKEPKQPRVPRTPNVMDRGVADAIGTVAWVLVVVLLLGGLAYLVYRYRKRPDLGVTRTDYGTTDELLAASADDLATGLKTNLHDGDYRLAIRMRFGQVLQALRERGLLKWVPGRTNLDYERALPVELAKAFGSLSNGFAYATYAGREVSAQRYEHFAAEAAAFLTLTPQLAST